MFRITLATALLFSVPLTACPRLDEVVPRIASIREALQSGSIILHFEEGPHKVSYGRTGKAVDKLLAGGFEGYHIHRLKHLRDGGCEYLVTDDHTPAMGTFILKAINKPRE